MPPHSLNPCKQTLVKSVFEMPWKEAGPWQKPTDLFLVIKFKPPLNFGGLFRDCEFFH